jgi:hypothetical protein
MFHVLFTKVTKIIPKSREVLFEHFAKELCIGLIDDLVKSIAIDERFLDARMRMEVKIKLYLLPD